MSGSTRIGADETPMDLATVAKLAFLVSALSMLVFHWKRRRPAADLIADTFEARPKEARAICDLLESSGGNGSFVAFIVPVDGPPEMSANIQFSVERGVVGLDWLLISPTNIRDVSTFERLVSEGKHTPQRLTQNDVSYLRVEDGDVVALFQRVLKEMYDVTEDEVLEVVAEGVTLPREAA